MEKNKVVQNQKSKGNKTNQTNRPMKLLIGSGLAVIVLVGIVLVAIGKNNKQQTYNAQPNSTQVQLASNNVQSGASSTQGQLAANGDLVIPLSGITEKASFYQYNVNGTKLEVIAIKAADGSIRTAFNTCQVCYSSGKGYYVQQGDNLVCQNCGNRFKADQVEVSKGGCNPVPIFDADKTVDGTNITIAKSFLEKSKTMFAKWKS
ncbi:DUF2318 domain-containing protein [[Clostridium] fimetarium]|uniref:Predicted membrane protein n=1 Tax=[Clostridium] fimetarium TaxID=99656 RepID=A0A1I0M6V5_9FIRM|nr:DUF2318 domain-containing protein [[Clostridium] fimetarium]SEV84012.1 Predicted membrane protein [[Clostridium] fimetarium]